MSQESDCHKSHIVTGVIFPQESQNSQCHIITVSKCHNVTMPHWLQFQCHKSPSIRESQCERSHLRGLVTGIGTVGVPVAEPAAGDTAACRKGDTGKAGIWQLQCCRGGWVGLNRVGRNSPTVNANWVWQLAESSQLNYFKFSHSCTILLYLSNKYNCQYPDFPIPTSPTNKSG